MGSFGLYRKVVIVTRKTRYEELIERYGTPEQAAFLTMNRGQSFHEIESAHHQYQQALLQLKSAVPRSVRTQVIERTFLPNFLFSPLDLVVTLGQDGLVVNVAKYLDQQPIAAFNPDPGRIDGVLLPFQMGDAADVLDQALWGGCPDVNYTMAEVRLEDGQRLYAVNDLFVGIQSHASARYEISYRGRHESQSSSGIIISTGAGSTGWLRSVLTASAGVAGSLLGPGVAERLRDQYRFDPTSRELRFAVREPFISRTTSAEIVFGSLDAAEILELQSNMPQGGVIFSDGMESDFLRFESGMRARIGVADRSVRLLTART